MAEGLPDVGVPEQDLFYLAAPFFNPAQIKVVEQIEDCFADENVSVFSPRLCDENKKGPPSDEGAKIIYRRNMNGLLRCSHMLAVVDWNLPESQGVYLIDDAKIEAVGAFVRGKGISKLNIPDAGTVYEMGAARMKTELRQIFGKHCDIDASRMLSEVAIYLQTFASNGSDCERLAEEIARFHIAFNVLMSGMRRMPVVIYTERAPTDALNLMLTQGCAGVINGIDELKKFLNGGLFQWNIPKQWRGGNR